MRSGQGSDWALGRTLTRMFLSAETGVLHGVPPSGHMEKRDGEEEGQGPAFPARPLIALSSSQCLLSSWVGHFGLPVGSLLLCPLN